MTTRTEGDLGPSIHCMVKNMAVFWYFAEEILDDKDNLLDKLNDDGLFFLTEESTKRKKHVCIQNILLWNEVISECQGIL